MNPYGAIAPCPYQPPAKSTQPGPANSGPGPEQDHLLEGDPQRHELREQAGEPGPAGPHHGICLEHARAEPDPRALAGAPRPPPAGRPHPRPARRGGARPRPPAARRPRARGERGGDPRGRGPAAAAPRPPASSVSTGTPSARSTRSLSASQPPGSRTSQATPDSTQTSAQLQPVLAGATGEARVERVAAVGEAQQARLARRTRPAGHRGRSGRSA